MLLVVVVAGGPVAAAAAASCQHYGTKVDSLQIAHDKNFWVIQIVCANFSPTSYLSLFVPPPLQAHAGWVVDKQTAKTTITTGWVHFLSSYNNDIQTSGDKRAHMQQKGFKGYVGGDTQRECNRR